MMVPGGKKDKRKAPLLSATIGNTNGILSHASKEGKKGNKLLSIYKRYFTTEERTDQGERREEAKSFYNHHRSTHHFPIIDR